MTESWEYILFCVQFDSESQAFISIQIIDLVWFSFDLFDLFHW